jgi:hypothetical protein
MPDQTAIQMLDGSRWAASTAAPSVQNVSKSPQRFARGGRARIRVDLHPDGLVGMPKDSHDHARMHIEINEQCGTRVPGVMSGDRAHSRGLAP